MAGCIQFMVSIFHIFVYFIMHKNTLTLSFSRMNRKGKAVQLANKELTREFKFGINIFILRQIYVYTKMLNYKATKGKFTHDLDHQVVRLH